MSETTSNPTSANASGESTFRQQARNFGWLLYLAIAVWGAAEIVFPDDGRAYFACAFCAALAATLWARADSRARGIQILPILQMLYFFVWPIGATVYLVYRSGWWGWLLVVGHLVALGLVMNVAAYATLFVLHFAGLIDPSFDT